jgi:hypothetical protein
MFAGQRFGERFDVAEPVIQAQLQGRVLPCGVSGGGGRHLAVPRRPQGLQGLGAKTIAGKEETLYVLPNSRAKAHAERRYPHKPVKVVDSGVRGR